MTDDLSYLFPSPAFAACPCTVGELYAQLLLGEAELGALHNTSWSCGFWKNEGELLIC